LSAARAASDRAKDFGDELAHFGWWFASQRFDTRWSLEQLRDLLGIAGKIEPDHVVMERLAVLATEEPFLTVEVTSMLIMAEARSRLYPSFHEEKLRQILQQSRSSSDPKARDAAKRLIDTLGAMGFLNFRNPLPS